MMDPCRVRPARPSSKVATASTRRHHVLSGKPTMGPAPPAKCSVLPAVAAAYAVREGVFAAWPSIERGSLYDSAPDVFLSCAGQGLPCAPYLMRPAGRFSPVLITLVRVNSPLAGASVAYSSTSRQPSAPGHRTGTASAVPVRSFPSRSCGQIPPEPRPALSTGNSGTRFMPGYLETHPSESAGVF